VLKLFKGLQMAALFVFFLVLCAVASIPKAVIAVLFGGRFEGAAFAVDAFCVPLWNAIASTVEAIQRRADEPIDGVFREGGLSIYPPGH
jgi:hypothetical protein